MQDPIKALHTYLYNHFSASEAAGRLLSLRVCLCVCTCVCECIAPWVCGSTQDPSGHGAEQQFTQQSSSLIAWPPSLLKVLPSMTCLLYITHSLKHTLFVLD